jgi:carbon-monoxide dehydrogenase large subunit
MSGAVGQPLRRLEDPRLLTGQGTYADDIQLPDMAYLAVKRSPHVHATIARIDLEPARTMPGVLAAADNRQFEGSLGPLPIDAGLKAYPDPRVPPRHPLAHGTVRYVGEPVAVVVADSRARARDAVEAIEVDYIPLPGVVDVERALEPDAPRVFEEFSDNIACQLVAAAITATMQPRRATQTPWSGSASSTSASFPPRWNRAAQSPSIWPRPTS